MEPKGSEEQLECIDTSDFKQKWILDPKGYFLIRIDSQKDLIEVFLLPLFYQ